MVSENVYRKDGYYQAIIQIRPKDKEVLEFIRKNIRSIRKAEISKEVFYNYGIDVYITDQKAARNMGEKLKKAFKGKLTITRKLFSQDRQTSRLIYRGTVLFRRAEEEQKINKKQKP